MQTIHSPFLQGSGRLGWLSRPPFLAVYFICFHFMLDKVYFMGFNVTMLKITPKAVGIAVALTKELDRAASEAGLFLGNVGIEATVLLPGAIHECSFKLDFKFPDEQKSKYNLGVFIRYYWDIISGERRAQRIVREAVAEYEVRAYRRRTVNYLQITTAARQLHQKATINYP